MTRQQIITPLILTLQIFGVIINLASKNPILLILITTFCSLYIFFQYRIFQDKVATIGSLVVLCTATIIACFNNSAIFLTSVPLITAFVIIASRQIFLKLTNAEPVTGKYLIKQRDRTYSWIVLNISIQLLFFSILQPWTERAKENLLWIPVIFLLGQLLIILIGWTIIKLRRRSRI